MKVTAVIDHNGEVVASVQAHQSEFSPLAKLGGKKTGGTPEAHPVLIAKPDQSVHEFIVPDELGEITEAEEFHRRLADHLPAELKR
jgi:hypothetical protein